MPRARWTGGRNRLRRPRPQDRGPAGRRLSPAPPGGPTTLDGLVLAGGAGRRLGRQKATVELAGTTLVERAVHALLPHCRRVVVVTRPGVVLPPLPADVVVDRPGPDTPLNGLATGLDEVDAARVLVLACDLPLAGALAARLAACPPPDPVAAADPAGRAQPLCARYARLPALAACTALLGRGELRLLPLLERLGARLLPASEEELSNVNGPGDLERVTARLTVG